MNRLIFLDRAPLRFVVPVSLCLITLSAFAAGYFFGG